MTIKQGNNDILSPRQRRAWELRQSGQTLAEIASTMGVTKEPIRQLIAVARHKLGLPPEWKGNGTNEMRITKDGR